MAGVPPPPDDLSQARLETLAAGTLLHRVHSSDFRGDVFNPCRGDPSRFAPIKRPDGSCIPTLYAAQSLEAALFETVFHDIDMRAAFKAVRRSAIDRRSHSQLEVARAIRLVTLFRPDLARFGMEREDLIATHARWYESTAAWAAALHRDVPAAQGLVWTSYRCDPDRACLLFGDRVDKDTIALRATRSTGDDPGLVEDIRVAAARAGILLAR